MTATRSLAIEDVSVSFGGLLALDAVSLVVDAGLVTGLIGPNGAGKTTLFNVATGFVRPSAGKVFLANAEVTRMRPDRRAKRGLARTFQRLEMFSSLSVRENVLVALEAGRRVYDLRWRSDASADDIIEKLGLGDVASVQVDRLSTGTIRLVEVARALATRPTVLLLDEPSAGLDGGERETLARLLGELAVRDGLAILLVEHDVDFVVRVCRYIYVLDFGRLIAAGDPAAVQADQAVQEAYLGVPSHSRAPSGAPVAGSGGGS
jgi:branched-chain amino acid transport system ATP-binding protein